MIRLFIISVLCLLSINACKQASAETNLAQNQVQTLKVEGLVQNANVSKLAIFKEDVVAEATIGADKSYTASFEGVPGYYEIILGRQRVPIYISGKGTLVANVDMRNVMSLSNYSGEGANETMYLSKKQKITRKYSGAARQTYGFEEAEFINAMETQRSDYVQLLNETTDLDPSFVEGEKLNIDFGIKAFAADYQNAQRYFKNDLNYTVSDAFSQKYGHDDFGNEALFTSLPEYKTMVYRHYIKPNIEASIPAMESLTSPVIKDALIKQLYNEIKPGFKDLDVNMDKLVSLSTDPSLKTALSNKYKQLKSIDKGAPSPSFSYKDVNGKVIGLDDMKGKNVYIDVWATWCGPCKREIPHLQALEKEYHGKNVEFVSISVDTPDKEAKWKQMVTDKAMSGTQLITGSGWDSPFVKSFLISGIPRFILLDTDHNIVSSNAPRPSSGTGIRQALNELL